MAPRHLSTSSLVCIQACVCECVCACPAAAQRINCWTRHPFTGNRCPVNSRYGFLRMLQEAICSTSHLICMYASNYESPTRHRASERGKRSCGGQSGAGRGGRKASFKVGLTLWLAFHWHTWRAGSFQNRPLCPQIQCNLMLMLMLNYVILTFSFRKRSDKSKKFEFD